MILLNLALEWRRVKYMSLKRLKAFNRTGLTRLFVEALSASSKLTKATCMAVA